MDTFSKKRVSAMCLACAIIFISAFGIEGRRGGLRSLRRQRQLRELPRAAPLPKCGVCDAAACPKLNYCEGRAVKDACSCCTVCDTRHVTPTLAGTGDNPCDKVQCPKFKVCTRNIQGVPLCGCPGVFMCRKMKKKKVCGTNGVTYESRCHMRIASCNQGLAVRKKYKGECSPENDAKAAKQLKRPTSRRRQNKKNRQNKNNNKSNKSKNKGSRRGRKNKKGGRGKRRPKRRKLRNGKSRRRRHNYFDYGKTFDEGNWGTWQEV